jgi:AbrB family looped-hinge helix DNA binding protein
MQTTIDAAGRIVIPKNVRDEAGIKPGMPLRVTCWGGRVEIEPEPVPIEIVARGRLKVAVAQGDVPPLGAALVEATRQRLAEERGEVDRTVRSRVRRKR